MKPHPRRRALAVEPLEDRSLPTTFGVPWADPGHLTLSFAPDGTATPSGSSSLSAVMPPAGPTTWQREVLRAFQTWAVNADINVGLVADGGQPLGAVGAVQGDPRFGDVRVAAAPVSTAEVAAASPFSWTGTTFAGDVVFGSASPYRLGNVAGTYDVFSVALHEAGHVLGLDHSATAGSAIGETYAFRPGLSADDIADLRDLYGVRNPDAYDAAVSNATLATASMMPKAKYDKGGQLLAIGDLTTMSDVDYYRADVTTSAAKLSVRLQAKGLSLLAPKVTVYNAAGQVVASGLSTDPLSNDVTLTVNAPAKGSYFVKVERAVGDVFGVGGYRLAVDALAAGAALPPIIDPDSPAPDGHANDFLFAAGDLKPKKVGKSDRGFDAEAAGVIEDALDVDSYKVRAPKAVGSAPMNLAAVVWGRDASPLAPRLRVFDAAGRPVAFQILGNEGGVFAVQVPNVAPNQVYSFQVSSRTPGGVGAYSLAADFNQSPLVAYDGLGTGTLSPLATTTTGTLTVAGAGAYQFALTGAPAWLGGGGVTMTVTNSSGKSVFTLDATAGQPPVTTVRYLAAGVYTVRYTYRTVAGVTAGPIRFDLHALKLTDGVGTYATTTTSGTGTTTGTGGYTYTGPTAFKPTGYAYVF